MQTPIAQPPLVVSDARFHQKHQLVWIVMITSANGGRRPGDIEVPASPRTGLPAPSLIRMA